MQARLFRVTVRGRLSPSFATAFEGVTVRSTDGMTTLTGVFTDQAQLYGVLERVADYGLELTEVVSEDHRAADTPDATSGAVRDARNGIAFAATFGAAWWVLDRLASSPPRPVPAFTAVAAATAVVVAGRVLLLRVPARRVLGELGFGRPGARGLLVALIAGTAAVATAVLGARAMGVSLHLRAEWPAVLLAVLIFHGVAEELVWRGFAFGYLRRRTTFRAAVAWSMPLIALTHVPILLNSGLLVGGLAVLTAAVTCIPFAYLWETGRRTIWAPALLHALIDAWQLFDRDYPPTFPALVMLAAVVVAPLTVWVLGRRLLRLPAVPSR